MNALYVSCPSEPFCITLSYGSFDVFGICGVILFASLLVGRHMQPYRKTSQPGFG